MVYIERRCKFHSIAYIWFNMFVLNGRRGCCFGFDRKIGFYLFVSENEELFCGLVGKKLTSEIVLWSKELF